MTKKIRLQQKTALARKALIRHTTAPGTPETKLIVDVIVQAIADTPVKPSSNLKKADKNDAIRFFGELGRLDYLCNLIGLNPEYARFVAGRCKTA